VEEVWQAIQAGKAGGAGKPMEAVTLGTFLQSVGVEMPPYVSSDYHAANTPGHMQHDHKARSVASRSEVLDSWCWDPCGLQDRGRGFSPCYCTLPCELSAPAHSGCGLARNLLAAVPPPPPRGGVSTLCFRDESFSCCKPAPTPES